MSKIINFYGSPNSGKSILTAKVFIHLNELGHSTEVIQEYAKELVWKKDYEALENQSNVTKVQCDRTLMLSSIETLDYAITDSPIELGLFYSNEYHMDCVSKMINETSKMYDAINIFIEFGHLPFRQEGRIHNQEESLQKSKDIEDYLIKNEISYLKVSPFEIDKIIDYVLN